MIFIKIRAIKLGWHARSAVDDSLHGIEETKRRNTMMLIALALDCNTADPPPVR